jgi:hypothetical protein
LTQNVSVTAELDSREDLAMIKLSEAWFPGQASLNSRRVMEVLLAGIACVSKTT